MKTHLTNRRVPPTIPTGLQRPAQGCESASYPGYLGQNELQPQRGCIVSFVRVRLLMQPLQGWTSFVRRTQGSSRTRNPGLIDGIPMGFTVSWARRAFSLLELMVSVAILAIIIVGLLAMFNQVHRAFRSGTAQVDVMEGGRAASGVIVRELQELAATPLPNGINLFAVDAFGSMPVLPDISGQRGHG